MQEYIPDQLYWIGMLQKYIPGNDVVACDSDMDKNLDDGIALTCTPMSTNVAKCDGIVQMYSCTWMQPNAIIITIDIISPHYLLHLWVISTAGYDSSHILIETI